MKMIRILWTGLLALGLCSCATPEAVRPPLPGEAGFNPGAGRGDHLLLTLQGEDGQDLLFVVDNGCDRTILDRSLEPKLGKRLHRSFIWYGYLGPATAGVYHAPALYLNHTRLLTDDKIYTDDLQFLAGPGRRLSGILGLDCLKHYCVQLDFQADKIRFMDPDTPPSDAWGKAFPLITSWGEVATHADFFGGHNASLRLDTGDWTDGVLNVGLFRRELREQARSNATNRSNAALGTLEHPVLFGQGSFGGDTYTNLAWHKCPPGLWLGQENILGLRFLARHLVTLNFPKRTLYLQRQSAGPPPRDQFGLVETLGLMDSPPAPDGAARFEAWLGQQPGGPLWLEAGQFLEDLKHQGRLPGWAKTEAGYIWVDRNWEALDELQAEIAQAGFPATRTVSVQKKGDPVLYHYVTVKTSPEGPWQLQKAWRTDAGGKIIEEFPVP
jgi:hypothetical protein